MNQGEPNSSWQPAGAPAWAWLIFTIAAMTLMWPILTGQFLGGDDQLIAGFAFRSFGAEYFREHGRIPEWNPYLFGGMPFIAAMHGDIFYPTAWLRWLVPTDIGMTLGFLIHLIVAGGAMYALLRALGLGWTAAVVAGVGYELSGILASMVRPGHDGKLFVAALAPLALLALLRAIRHGRIGGYGAFALIVGATILSPHYQTAYYLLVASGLFTLWLVFLDPERVAPRRPVAEMGGALTAVLLGVGIGMIQGLPFLKYVPHSPRVEGGDSSGWEYATSYAMPIDELMSTILPQFNGIFELYWGSNFFKTHGEYLGVLVLALAIFGVGAMRKRRLLLPFAVIAGLFLLVSLGGHTPFYRLWYEVMPMMKKVRAAGMAFYLVALPVTVAAGFGIERLLAGKVSTRMLVGTLGTLAAVGLLAAIGALQPVAEALAPMQRQDRVIANASALQLGGVRVLLFALVGGAIFFAIQQRRLAGAAAAGLLVVAVTADNWSVMRHYPQWFPPAAETYAPDPMIAQMTATPMPFRNFDPRSDAIQEYNLGVYQGSWLMADRVPTVFGYHGNESRYFDELWGTKNAWQYQLSPSLWNLYAVRFLTLGGDPGPVPGYHVAAGPVSFPNLLGRKAMAGYLIERDTVPSWVRVVPGAIAVPAAQLIPTVVDPRFPVDQIVLFPDTANVSGVLAGTDLPEPTEVTAELAAWEPGRMTVRLEGSDSRTTWLLVAENWLPGWEATVDGVSAVTRAANHAMLSVAVPPGAREITLHYVTPGYATGKMITAISLLMALGLMAFGRFRGRAVDG